MFLQKGARMGTEISIAMPTPVITRLTFNQTAFNQEVPPEIKPVKPQPRPKPKPKPEPIKKTRPKAVAVKKVKPVEKIEKNEPVKQTAATPQSHGQQVSVSSEKILQQKREQYLQKLLSHIESYKFYPRAARSRSIEGNVIIVFTLQDDGSYQQLVLNGKRSVLVNATRMALEAATPLPVPADDLELSRQIKFTMVYSLTQ
ncbi:MAG: energy transducer TonB [Gammaproteobacteria bacterium]|nr:energy transducer TonB [Gammaproteobacteria bacterium]